MREMRGTPPRTVHRMTKAFEKEVTFEIDGLDFSFATWSDVSALFAIRFLAKHDRPKRGCESGLCGTCESLVDGVPTRLCLVASTSLDGVSIVSGSRPGR
jgi:aerobic-type carbon monoxide dehydrogenase small subunit (CoxS/CutS family)